MPRRLLALIVLLLISCCTLPNSSSAQMLTGTDGDDFLVGTPAGETIMALGGNDAVDGRGGRDDIDGGIGADDLHGGSGIDAVLYGGRALPVAVTLDNDANDGQAGEGDNARADIEQVFGGAAGDRLSGSRGADLLDGAGGDDFLSGGAGSDRLYGGPGDDRIMARDGHADIIDCGPGSDFADTDVSDAVQSCERSPGPGTVKGRLALPLFGVIVGVGTRVIRMTVVGLQKGARVELRCKGGGCPFSRRQIKRRRSPRIKLAGVFGTARLRPGATLEVRLLAPRLIGRVVRYEIVQGRVRPKRTNLCLPPGETRPRRQCR
jgi:hypothetical protein